MTLTDQFIPEMLIFTGIKNMQNILMLFHVIPCPVGLVSRLVDVGVSGNNQKRRCLYLHVSTRT